MRFNCSAHVVTAAAALLSLVSFAPTGGKPEEELAGTIRVFFERNFVTDWQGIERLPHVQWAPLPPTELQNCLPDGACFTRQGRATFGNHQFLVVATGARSIVFTINFRNTSAPVGEALVVSALGQVALTAELARCPVQDRIGGTNWYRIRSAETNPGYLSVQSSCNDKPCEGFVLTLGEELPPLQPKQLSLYTDKCSATGEARTPVSTVLPHIQLAHALVALIPPASGPVLYDWKTLRNLPTGINWNAGEAKSGDLSYKGDSNPWIDQGMIDLSGRRFYLLFSGSPSQVKTAYFDEAGMHPSGEHLLGVLYELGFAVKLVRCGPVYSESTNNWYNVTSAQTRPAMLRQSIRYDGSQVQDSYELRLDGSLPNRDPRDRDPGAAGCK